MINIIEKVAGEVIEVKTEDGIIKLSYPPVSATIKILAKVEELNKEKSDPDLLLLKAGAMTLSACTGMDLEQCEKYVLARKESPAIMKSMELCALLFGKVEGDSEDDESGVEGDELPFSSQEERE